MTKPLDFKAQVYAVVEEHVAAVHAAALEELRAQLAKVRTTHSERDAGAERTDPPRGTRVSRPPKKTAGSRRARRGSSTSSAAATHKPRRVKRRAAAAPAAGSSHGAVAQKVARPPKAKAGTATTRSARSVTGSTSGVTRRPAPPSPPKPTPASAAVPRAGAAKIVELLRAGRPPMEVAAELGVTNQAVYQARKRWMPEVVAAKPSPAPSSPPRPIAPAARDPEPPPPIGFRRGSRTRCVESTSARFWRCTGSASRGAEGGPQHDAN